MAVQSADVSARESPRNYQNEGYCPELLLVGWLGPSHRKPRLWLSSMSSHTSGSCHSPVASMGLARRSVEFQFLRPAVHNLRYWGTEIKGRKARSFKPALYDTGQAQAEFTRARFSPQVWVVRWNSVKVLYNLGVFLYHRLKEISWMPQLCPTLGTPRISIM